VSEMMVRKVMLRRVTSSVRLGVQDVLPRARHLRVRRAAGELLEDRHRTIG
jgi:hypothetical protein